MTNIEIIEQSSASAQSVPIRRTGPTTLRRAYGKLEVTKVIASRFDEATTRDLITEYLQTIGFFLVGHGQKTSRYARDGDESRLLFTTPYQLPVIVYAQIAPNGSNHFVIAVKSIVNTKNTLLIASERRLFCAEIDGLARALHTKVINTTHIERQAHLARERRLILWMLGLLMIAINIMLVLLAISWGLNTLNNPIVRLLPVCAVLMYLGLFVLSRKL
jgi:hypothetical protein